MPINPGTEKFITFLDDLMNVIHDQVEAHLMEISDGEEVFKVKHYAGEFLSEDNMERLKLDVSQFPHVFYDVELVDILELNDDQTVSKFEVGLLFFCTVGGSYFDYSDGWASSYGLGWELLQLFSGLTIDSVGPVHSNGIIAPSNIERELHVPGISVHTFRASVIFTADSNQ